MTTSRPPETGQRQSGARWTRFREYLQSLGVDEGHRAYTQFVQYHINLARVRSEEIYEILKTLTQVDGAKVLEVGSGAGSFLEFLLDRGADAHGIELDEGLARCSATLDRVIVGDTYALPVRAESFDVVISVDVLEHLSNQPKAIREMFSAVRKGGKLVLIVNNRLFPWDPHSHLPFIAWLPRRLAEAYARWFDRDYDVELPTSWSLYGLGRASGSRAKVTVMGCYTIWGFYNQKFGRWKWIGRWLQVLADRVSLVAILAPKLILVLERI